MFKSSFLWRLYAGFVAVIAICALVINLLLSQYIQESGKKSLENNLLARAHFLHEIALPALKGSNLPLRDNIQLSITKLDQNVSSRLTIIDASGIVIADSRQNPQHMDNHLLRPEIKEASFKGIGQAQRFSNTVQQNMKYLALTVKEDKQILGFVRVALPLKEIQQAQQQLTQYILAGCILAALIALLLGFYFARRFSLPIIALTKSADAIAQGDYQQRVYLKNKDEIGKLAQSFNFMASSANDRVLRITEDRNKLATILSGLVEGVIAVDEEQNIIHINEAAARTLQISASASIGTSVWTSIRIVEIHDILQHIFAQGGISQNQVRIPGELKDTVIEVYGAALQQSETRHLSKDNSNTRHGAILVLHDVSELEMLENIRRDFVTNASHELKTPLTAIRGVVETILHDPEMERETIINFLQRVQKQTERLVNIVSDLMALSRLETGRSTDLEPLSLKAILNQSIKSFSTIALEKNVSLSLYDKINVEEKDRVLGDAHALGQLFDNLIDNAIKYTPNGGAVEALIMNETINNEQWITIHVKDNGLGINKIDQTRIFERFYRVDKGRSRDLGGTGLGLAITKHITEQHNGLIQLKSELGKGSTFIVSLPLNL